MPKYVAFGSVEGDEIAVVITAKQEVAGSGQDSRTAQTAAQTVDADIRMAPSHLAGFMVERLQHMLRPKVAARTSVSLRVFAGVGEVGHTVAAHRIDVKQPGLRTVTGRDPIGSPAPVNGQQVAIHRRFPFRVGYTLPLHIDTLRPVKCDKGF